MTSSALSMRLPRRSRVRIPDDPTTAHEANPSLGAPSFLRSARLSLNSPHQLVALALATTVLAPAGGATSGIVDRDRGEAQFGSLEVWLTRTYE